MPGKMSLQSGSVLCFVDGCKGVQLSAEHIQDGTKRHVQQLAGIKVFQQGGHFGSANLVASWHFFRLAVNEIRLAIGLESFMGYIQNPAEERRVLRGDHTQNFQVAGSGCFYVHVATCLLVNNPVNAEFV